MSRQQGYFVFIYWISNLTHWGRDKWTPFRRRHFQLHFPEWKCLNCEKTFSLKFVPKGQINNIPALVQIMAWRRPGDKPLSEPMMVSLTTHICVTRPQWVKETSGLTVCFNTVLFMFQTQPTYLDGEYTCIKLGWQKTIVLALFCPI